jgi:hypothetical protein
MKLTGAAPTECNTVIIDGDNPLALRQRHLTQARRQRLYRDATTKVFRPVDGRDTEEVDTGKLWRAMVKHQIAGWSGMTAKRIDQLAPLDEGEGMEFPDAWGDDIPCDHDVAVFTDAGGTIPGGKSGETYTLPEYVYRRAEPFMFQDVIERVNKAMTTAAVEESFVSGDD